MIVPDADDLDGNDDHDAPVKDEEVTKSGKILAKVVGAIITGVIIYGMTNIEKILNGN